MAHSLPRYQPSGFFRVTTIAFFAAAVVAGCLLAWLYQMAVRFIPYVQANLVLVLFFGIALGVGGAYAVKRGHCRNRLIAGVLALALAGAPLAASYYFDYRYVLSEVAKGSPGATADEVAQEIPFRRFLELKQKWGWKMKGGGKLDGWGVLVIWGLEALTVFGATLALTLGAVGEPYCEKCNRFCAGASFGVYGVGRAAADPLLAAGSLDRVLALESPEGGDPMINLTLTVTTCPSCQDTGFLTVAESKRTMKGKKTTTSTSTLVKHAVLSAQLRETAVARLTAARGQKLSA